MCWPKGRHLAQPKIRPACGALYGLGETLGPKQARFLVPTCQQRLQQTRQHLPALSFGAPGKEGEPQKVRVKTSRGKLFGP